LVIRYHETVHLPAITQHCPETMFNLFLVIWSSYGYPMRRSWVYLQAMGWFLDYIVIWSDIWDTDMKSMEDARDTSNALIPLAAKTDRLDDRVTKTIDLRVTHSYSTWQVAHSVRHASQLSFAFCRYDAGKHNVVNSFLYICTWGNLNCWPHNPSCLMVNNIVWCVWLTIRHQSLILGWLYCRLSCTPYSHQYHVMVKVITLTGMETVRLLMNSNVGMSVAVQSWQTDSSGSVEYHGRIPTEMPY
jgi:hypothetical protein